ncbi:aldehyde dehydrogenase family protein [Ornithinimicrobium sufpigmenti]|uniref:aldehyde dehydrogenase family protein n=1 Tax=Ornithinimicrobium sufpigmenti TaxID=2508882 RepID=UPI001036E486|nr:MULTISPECIES: aldehyde dehydrogenase family protein [unclassified Ornithinimicrobium]
MTTYRSLVAGEWIGGQPSPHLNPSDLDDVVGHSALADAAVAEAAVEAAVQAQNVWQAFPVAERIAILDRIGSQILQRTEELATLLSREEGKLLAEARGEVARAGQTFRYHAHELLQPQGERYLSTRPGVEAEVRHRPLGAVGIITPWNYPIAIPAWKIAPALAHGNTVVFKPAELVPALAGELSSIIHDSGIPPGVFNMVLGPGPVVGETLLTSVRLHGISFTGSAATGRHVARQCLEHGNKRFQLELGGKNPLIVMDDADLDVAARCALDGAFFSTGQRCTASSRLIVHERVHDAFVDRIVSGAEALRVGPALAPDSQIGPVVDAVQLERNLDYVRIGCEEGAELAAGGARVDEAGNGWFMRPTVFTGVRNDMRIAQEEIFGPVTAVISAENLDEAIALANDTSFGLSAGIVTTSLRHATEFKRRVRAGVISVNLPTAGTELHLPFGGMRGSNHGPREAGRYARDFYTQPVTCYTAW